MGSLCADSTRDLVAVIRRSAADVYAHPAHVGRAGWTWYTGSAGWMYQAAIEGLLGLRRRGATFSVNPSIPAMWPGYSLQWVIDGTRFNINVANPESQCRGVVSATMDGGAVDPNAIPLKHDKGLHQIEIALASEARVSTSRGAGSRREPARQRRRQEERNHPNHSG